MSEAGGLWEMGWTPPSGHRLLPEPTTRPTAERLRAACAINKSVAALLPGGRIAAPKGVYRFRTLDEANRQQDAWLAEAMAETRPARQE